MFIDIAGIDGCGKSTVSAGLSKLLCSDGLLCKVFHGYQPRKTMFMLRDLCEKAGISFKESSQYNTLGMAAALMDIFNNTRKLFSDNSYDILISEKYIKDSIVYMPLLGGDSNLAQVYEKALPAPNLRIILDVDAKIARMRILERSRLTGKPIHEKESYDIMRSARLKFQSFADEANTEIVDGSQPQEYVLSQVYDLVVNTIINQFPMK